MGMGRNIPGRSALIFLGLLSLLNGQESFVPLISSVESPLFLFTSEEKQEVLVLEEEELLQEYIASYSSNWGRGYLERVLEESHIFRYNIGFQLWEAGIPQDLLSLPVIESGWDPYSLSSSGALGIWQFMNNSIPSSFVQNRWVEDRKGFIQSTEAAISKFNFNLDKTNQDWLLALAGYNCGINHIIRSQNENASLTYWDMRSTDLLPDQTIQYIPRLLAVNHILSRKVRFGLEIDWQRSPYWISLPLSEVHFMPALSDGLEMPLEVLQRANGELNDWLTPENYHIKVPHDRLRLLLDYLEEQSKGLIEPSLETDTFNEIFDAGPPVHRIHILEEGETLWQLSQIYSVTLDELEERNPHLNADTLQPGTLLFIP